MYTFPLAYLITWTLRGTWLHGDPRGSVDRYHNRFGSVPLKPDLTQLSENRERLGSTPERLDENERGIVACAIRDHSEIRGWTLLAVNVRSNHVHAVVDAPGVPPERVLVQFKGWATRRLVESGCRRHRDAIWTRHGSTRYLFDKTSVDAAVDYVMNRQD